ncbi:MAG: hypothetical protein H7343_01230 [Undibacterium sp.]|nr:hypothetical protein [Opitutaceae bacterium]
MIVIRRMVDRHQSFTGIFLPGEPARIFPTTDYEHGRILQIYKQDRPHEGIINDFTDLDAFIRPPTPTEPASAPTAKPAATSPATASPPRKKRKPAAAKPRRGHT